MRRKHIRWSTEGNLRVLMQTRPEVFTQPGGDTVVVSQLQKYLTSFGVTVELDLEGTKRPEDFDVVQLFNFALPEHTERLARRAASAGVPYFVVTMYEDRPRFFNQMLAHYLALHHYIGHGQIREQWLSLMDAAKKCDPSPRWENTWTAEHAACLFATGHAERETIQRDYPNVKNVRLIQCGSDIDANRYDPSLFQKQYGISDFVLCVGRLETRKNQLMLLKALEDSDLTLVFAGSGFTYQPEYEEMCRAFKRKGKTIFLPRLEPSMLASAYAAARVHALPSWYELPGLVTIEAARAGAAVVTSDFGTIRDYLGSDAYYAAPDNADGIRRAVLTAYGEYPERKEHRESTKARLTYLTWENTARQAFDAYRDVLAGSQERIAPTTSRKAQAEISHLPAHHAVAAVSAHAAQAQHSVAAVGQKFEQKGNRLINSRIESLCTDGEELLHSGDVNGALEIYRQALTAEPNAIKPRKGLGVAYLLQKEWTKAAAEFRLVVDAEPDDAKALAGCGAALWQLGQREEAFRYYVRACAADADDLTAITHLMQASYSLSRFDDLERVLRAYVRHHAENLDMQYCLAGCYLRQKKTSHAMGLLERILHVDPQHARALELKQQVTEQEQIETTAEQAPAAGGTAGDAPIESQLMALERARDLRDHARVIDGAMLVERDPQASLDDRSYATILRGEALACLGNFAEARQAFVEGRSNAVHAYRALTGLGVLEATASKWSDAEKLFIEACAKKPDYDVAIAGLGLCAAQFGDREKAWSYYRRALAANPENIRALYGLIELGYQLRRFSDVETAIAAYLEHRPLDLSMLYSLAGCLYAQGEVREAREVLGKILFVQPEHAMALELMTRLEHETQRTSASNM